MSQMTSFVRRNVERLPTLLLIILSLFFLWTTWKPSSQPDVYMFSLLRISILLLLAAIILYAVLSLRSKNLIRINNRLAYTGLVGSLILEGILRQAPYLIPDDAIRLLPTSAQTRLAGDRGLFTRELVTGEGLLFHWMPNSQLPRQANVAIDANGYRNDNMPDSSIDVVLLGASVLYGPTVEHDLGRRLRESGLDAYSLAFAAYGPNHYLDAYRNFIIERGIAHRQVLILVMTPYDLDKAIEYERIKASGGTYYDFFAVPPAIGSLIDHDSPSWVLSIYAKLPIFVAQKVIDRRRTKADVTVRLDYGTFSLPEAMFFSTRRDAGWPLFDEALGKILSIARSHDAEPIVIYYPDTPLALLPYIERHGEDVRQLENEYRKTISHLATVSAKFNGRFIDSTPWFQERIRKEPLTISPFNYHLNQRGTDVLLEFVRPMLRRH